jgi:hypothetical protein
MIWPRRRELTAPGLVEETTRALSAPEFVADEPPELESPELGSPELGSPELGPGEVSLVRAAR